VSDRGSPLSRVMHAVRLDELSRFIYKPAIPTENAVHPPDCTSDALKILNSSIAEDEMRSPRFGML